MKRLASVVLLMAAVVSLRGAPSEIGFLPEEKVGVTVPPTERNPFGKRLVKAPDAVVEEKGTEEAQIRDIISKLTCGGVIRGGGKTKALLGSFQVEEGTILPQILPEQKEKLKVVAINKDRVELVFVESDGKPENRKITVPYDLGANVHFKLEGASKSPKKDAGMGGVIKKNEPAPSAQ